ncbi:hypothetical protein [Sphingopyxis macrogoltabida]|uniref:Polyprotein n=1 Tax=Sphingopyxis macrogoltabida TaxID=33050 RepID=A0AAC9FFS1_SPHMC|nr:hypothetical protein [Sphingopyxis macrogoltabida]ALJ14127.1 polyprotein [Sphingopyxis macrogoltabida]AMU90393.1 polyprotein [Sphingopyxis macrogoltabida]
MASVAPITPQVNKTSALSVARDVQSLLSQAEAVLTLAINDIEGTGNGVNALGAVRGLIELSNTQTEDIEMLLMQEGRA